LFQSGIAVAGVIQLFGFNLYSDSFNSTDPFASTAGLYDPSKAKSNGDIRAWMGITNNVNIGNASIHGSIATGPNQTVQFGAQGFVTGGITDDMELNFPEVVVPFASGGYYTAPSGVNIVLNGTVYTQVYNQGLYKITTLSLAASSKILINGDVSIWCPGGLAMAGQSRIDIGTGARLTLYLGSSSNIGGNGISSNSGRTTSCIIYGLGTCTSLSLGGNANFVGCVYAPATSVVTSSGGNNAFDISGSLTARNLALNGHLNLHYDENLKQQGYLR
jgi:hypothetical protein